MDQNNLYPSDSHTGEVPVQPAAQTSEPSTQSFGNTPAAPAAQQTSSFSQPAAQQNTSFSQPAAQQTSPFTAPAGQQTSSFSQPAEQQNTSFSQPAAQQTASFGAADFSRYQDTASSFTSIPRETVYINNNQTESPEQKPQKKEKAPKGRLGLGAIAAIVAVCMIFSGGAAFVGTYAANKLNGQKTVVVKDPVTGETTVTNSGAPSVIFQSFTGNKTAGGYEQVADAVAPTVVEIRTESVSTASFWGGNYVTSGAGSGVIISADGVIVTNNHVVSGANTITVTLKDGTEYPAKLLGTDSDSDIAVIKIEASNLPCALVGNSDELKVGQEVLAIGNPLGELGGTVTNGIVSALAREIDIDGSMMTVIQTNAEVNPGNSGGGLFNLYGELIGIVNAKSTSTSSGTAVEGIGFAIPVNTASKVAAELINYGYVRGKVKPGISYIDIADSWDAMYYRVNSLGVYIVSSEFTDELKSGDRITAIDGKEVTYSTDIKPILKDHKVGDTVVVKVVRNGQYIDVKVTLREYVPAAASNTDQSAFEQNAGKGITG